MVGFVKSNLNIGVISDRRDQSWLPYIQKEVHHFLALLIVFNLFDIHVSKAPTSLHKFLPLQHVGHEIGAAVSGNHDGSAGVAQSCRFRTASVCQSHYSDPDRPQ